MAEEEETHKFTLEIEEFDSLLRAALIVPVVIAYRVEIDGLCKVGGRGGSINNAGFPVFTPRRVLA
jgi:hypothetical protein